MARGRITCYQSKIWRHVDIVNVRVGFPLPERYAHRTRSYSPCRTRVATSRSMHAIAHTMETHVVCAYHAVVARETLEEREQPHDDNATQKHFPASACRVKVWLIIARFSSCCVCDHELPSSRYKNSSKS